MARSDDADSEASDISEPSLLGRDPELERLFGLIEWIEVGGGALVVRGEAGIGKSALVAAASDRARRQGATVVTTTGTQFEARLAFAGLHRLLRQFLGSLERLPGPQRSALETAFGMAEGEAPDIFLIALAALGLVAEGAAESPLLLVVDDAQWLDQPSVEVLAFVARRLEIEPVFLLFAVRDGVASDIDDTDLPALQLAGLDADASSALLDLHAPGLPNELKARILDEAGGNPLALIELPAAAGDLGDRSPTSGPLPLTNRLERAFATRLPDLDAQARALLLLAALDNGTLSELNHAAALFGGPVDPDAWTRASDAGLGTLDGESFRFRHPLIRSAVQQAATAGERRRAHAALADALAGQPDRAVWHQASAATAPDDEVASALDAAASRAQLRGGFDVAIAALERAADLTGDEGTRALRLSRAGSLAYGLGRFRDSVRLFREAQQLGLPPYQQALASFHLEALSGAWSGASTIQDFTHIAQDFAKAGDHWQAITALYDVALRAYWANLDDETRRDATAVVDQLAVSSDTPLRVHVLGLLDPVQRGAEVIDRIERMSPQAFSDGHDLFLIGAGASAVWADNLALPFLRAAALELRADGRLTFLTHSLVFEAWAELRRGSIRRAITAAAEGVRLGEETGAVRYILAAKLAHAIAAAERGEDELAERLVTEAESAILSTGANPFLALVALARARHALAIERFGEAYEHLLRIFDPADAAHQPFVRGWALADLVDAAVRGDGDLDLVRGFLTEWDEIAAGTMAPHLEVQLTYAQAILADDDIAEECYRNAVTSKAATWPFYAARAQLAYGEWLRRQRRAMDSRAPLREAAQTFEALGQVRFAERARRELRASGERARRRVPEAWAQLSPQELQIAQLAADGLSNREIGERLYLSHRTVGSHLYRLFPKLGITSRTQVRDALEPSPEP
jgi:DNA-binding CsgD family transcriptional regulator/tetratricopeptide (TPR) repeat protein